MKPQQQLELGLDLHFEEVPQDNPALFTPRDIYTRLNQRWLDYFREGRRFERKGGMNVDLDDLATYYSTFSNTPDGGTIVWGVENDGTISGCNRLSDGTINKIETCHVSHCPLARPQFRRVPVVVNGESNFCIAIYVPEIGILVETNKGEAWIRYGESRHKMSEEEKQDFRSTRQELSFELMGASTYEYPRDFELQIIQDFCDQYRSREPSAKDWTREEVLVDRMLLKRDGRKFKPLNSLVLLAAKTPRLTIPGCRIRIQRFEGTVEGTGESYNPIRDRYVEGNAVQLIQRAQEVISDNIFDVTWLDPSDGKFTTTQEYPRLAWLEALINACVHRSYSFSGSEITVKMFSDRMEIESPGGFVPPVNEKTIYTIRSNRNPHLMDAMRILGYVRMAREGTRRIRESMNELHLPDPLFKQEALHGVLVRVTLMNDSRKRATDRDVALYFGVRLWEELQPHEIKLAAHAYHNQTIQVSEAQRITGRTWATSKKDLERLVFKGVLVFEPGEFVRDSRALYRLAPKERMPVE
jgi:ATP-dependent DNA helicase RecG